MIQADSLFRQTDDLSGGVLQTLKRKWKLRLRLMWFRHELRAWFGYMRTHGFLHLYDSDPSQCLKCTRTYLWHGLRGAERLQAQLAFFNWLRDRFEKDFVHQFFGPANHVLHELHVEGAVITASITPARGLGREGELAVLLSLNNEIVMQAAFTVLPADMLGLDGNGAPVMFIGCLQGGKDSRERIRRTTLLMERVKPSVLMLNVLQSIAQAWQLHAIVAVGSQTHAYSGYRRTLAKRVRTDYDTLWQELGATMQTPLGHWQLPLQWVPQAEADIESKKRAAYRRRRLFRQEFMQACHAASGTLGRARKHEAQS